MFSLYGKSLFFDTSPIFPKPLLVVPHFTIMPENTDARAKKPLLNTPSALLTWMWPYVIMQAFFDWFCPSHSSQEFWRHSALICILSA
jgi:hypothetical protein